MKRIPATLAVFLGLLSCAGSPSGQPGAANSTSATLVYKVSVAKGKELSLSQGLGKKPGVQAFFDAIALEVKPGHKDQFVVGDNLAGYYEAYSQDYQRGAGYVLAKTGIFQNYASFTGGQINDRTSGQGKETILPYGNKVVYPNGTTEEFALLSKQHALAVTVSSNQPAELAVLPIVKPLLDSFTITQADGAILLSPLEPDEETTAPQYLAISADQDFQFSAGMGQAPGSIKTLGLSGADAALYVHSQLPVTSLTVVVAFGQTPEAAVKKAVELAAGDPLKAEKQAYYDRLTASYLWTDDMDYNKALTWAKAAAHLFVVEEFGTGIWAGLPWFRDNWGRDTFIALPGTLLVSGQFAEAKAVLANFARYQNLGYAKLKITLKAEADGGPIKAWLEQKFPEATIFPANGAIQYTLSRDYALDANLRESLKADLLKAFPDQAVEVSYKQEKDYGRVPNRVAAGDSIIYNTVDGTPWMLREALEYIQYTGDQAFAAEMYKLAVPYFEGAIKNYVDADGLLTHDDADTWMDARISGKAPWSARGPRAVEIQALWYTALQTGATLADQAGDKAKATEWRALAKKAKDSFLRLFWDGSVMADRLRADASRDTKVRPNQLMLVSIPFDSFVPIEVEAQVTKNAVGELLYPYGIASLSQNDPYFHPIHENVKYHHKDAAYHQGTVWGWNSGFTVTALNKFGYQDLAFQLARNLGDQIMNLGTRGNMSELLNALPDENGQIQPSGTYAQSWSVAEYARNGYQDFLGFHPNLMANTVTLAPALPAAWKTFTASLPFGQADRLDVEFTRPASGQRFSITLQGTGVRKLNFVVQNADRSRSVANLTLTPAVEAVLEIQGGKLLVNGQAVALSPVQASYSNLIGELKFQTPKKYNPATASQDFPMLKEKNVLKGIVDRKEYR